MRLADVVRILILSVITLAAVVPVIAQDAGNLDAVNTPSLTKNDSGLPVGGGEGYGDWVTNYDVFVRNRTELLDALANATSSTVIYVADDAVIELFDEFQGETDWGTDIPGGVTLASGRGRNGSLGALIFMRTMKSKHLFNVTEPDVRVTGLRLRGPFTEIDGPDCGNQDASGIRVASPNDQIVDLNFEIDNSELWGWPLSPVSTEYVEGTHVHHNHIHHNRRQERTPNCRAYGLGYGVVTNKGDALIEYNQFNHNRHDIASTGLPGSSYTARYNWSVEGLIGHSFDMHGCPDRPTHAECVDDVTLAGERIEIYDNTFMQSSQYGVVIRGIPTVGVRVYNNDFRHATHSAAVKQINYQGNLHVFSNQYGVNPLPGWFISHSGTDYWMLRALSEYAPESLAVGDFDGDGTMDLFRSNGSRWYVSRSARQDWEQWGSSEYTVPSLGFADFNGDGHTDVFRSSGGRWYVSWGGSSRWQRLNVSSIGLSSLRFGDFNGDGQDDIFRTSGSQWYVSQSGSGPWRQINTSNVILGSLGFGDFDGDGTTDVFRGNGSAWYVSWSATSPWRRINTSSYTVANLGFCDFNGDEKTDILRTTGSAWYVSWSGISPWSRLNTSSYSLDKLALGDFNGDGSCDVLTKR